MAPNNIHTIHSSNTFNPGEPVPKSFKERYCPGMTRLWYLNPAKFDPRHRDRDDTIRRICMLVTFGCHTALNVAGLILAAISLNIMGLFISLILTIIFFNFMCWALPTIGDAQGERMVLGKAVGRRHFDTFLMFCAVMYSAALLGTLFGMGGIAGLLLGLVPLPLWLCIWLVAWIATWDHTGVSLA